MTIFNPNTIHQQISFSERLNNTQLWISKTKELLYAANKIKPIINAKWKKIKVQHDKVVDRTRTPNIQGIYFMLIAYALENLCKAILIYRKKESLSNRLLKSIPDEMKGHDLLRLVKNIGLRLNITTEELLVRLSRNSIWEARYPLPIESSKMTLYEEVSNEKKVFVAFFTQEDINKIDGLIKRFKNLIKIELKIDI